MVALRCYDPSGHGGGIHLWYAQSSDDVRATIDAALEVLAEEAGLSGLPHVKALRGACRGLHEVIVNTEDHRLFRILGFEGPSTGEFTLLLGLEKTQRGNIEYGPACASALQRKRGVLRDGRRAPPCRFP